MFGDKYAVVTAGVHRACQVNSLGIAQVGIGAGIGGILICEGVTITAQPDPVTVGDFRVVIDLVELGIAQAPEAFAGIRGFNLGAEAGDRARFRQEIGFGNACGSSAVVAAIGGGCDTCACWNNVDRDGDRRAA